MLTDIEGVQVGHWTDAEARTGCTVVILPPATVASGEVRGGAPATREFALLEPIRTVQHVDAVVLSGGSAFGLAAGQGVMEWLEANDRGFETTFGRVPIVVGMSIFDLGIGDPTVRPGPAEGAVAAAAATGAGFEVGSVGAGTGATVAKWGAAADRQDGGLVTATLRAGDLVVSALVVANAVGSVDDGTFVGDPGPPVSPDAERAGDDGGAAASGRENTTIGVVATNAVVDKLGCHLLAQSAHDGLARSLLPAHTAGDGDAFVAAATGSVEADLAHVRVLGQQAVTRAIRSLLP